VSREARDWEHDHDPNDYADSRIPLEDRRYDVVGDVRYAVCRTCSHVICVCDIADEEAPRHLRNHAPAAPRVVRDDLS
jgi:hypothetical protein